MPLFNKYNNNFPTVIRCGLLYKNSILLNKRMRFNDVILTYTNFDNIIDLTFNIAIVEYAFSIHFYHIIMYYQKFVFDDWLHHIIMIFISLPLSLLYNTGTLTAHFSFFVTGFPGGVNYFLLFLERNKLIERQTQKYFNYHLNLWIRQPGCIASATLGILFINKYSKTLIENIGILYIIISHYWNGIYFMEQVMVNYNNMYNMLCNKKN